MTGNLQLNSAQLFAKWLLEDSGTLTPDFSVLRIHRAEPRFQTKNYFARFKVEIAHLDGSGMNPTQVSCVVVEVSETDQSSAAVSGVRCESIKSL